ncbi:hypothetical protein [Mesorhizobium sp. A556]
MTALDPRAVKSAWNAYAEKARMIPWDSLHPYAMENVAPAMEAAITAYLAATQPQAGEPVEPLGRDFEAVWDKNAAELYESDPVAPQPALAVKGMKALEWAISEIEGRTRYDNDDQFDNAMNEAKKALSASNGEAGANMYRAPVDDDELQEWANLRADDAGRLARELIGYRLASPPPSGEVEALPISSLWQNKIDDMGRANGILESQNRELRLRAERAEAHAALSVSPATADGWRQEQLDAMLLAIAKVEQRTGEVYVLDPNKLADFLAPTAPTATGGR